MRVIPAMDLLGGRVVRLHRGDYAKATVYHDDPLAVVDRFLKLHPTSPAGDYAYYLQGLINFNEDLDPVVQLVKNPDVTVRFRGVMEKCTYCVQRIRRADLAERAGAAAPTLQTACQQACPTRAIEFGSLTEPGSSVAALHRNER